jgi:prepilin-type N-terminal cleavage/methylation domain-containing protein
LKSIQNSKLKIQNHRQGFTLIEMLVVVFVVGMGLIGALSFFSLNIGNQAENKNELIAAGLAQEGVELVRNIRDYNLLNGYSWDQGLSNCSAIDFNSLSTHQCSGAGSAVCLDANSRYYQCSSGNTGFTRTINVSGINPDGSRKITCTVSWDGRTIQSVDYLYNNSFLKN